MAATYDLIIAGGGPAGLTAAVYAARKKLRTLLLADEIGGQPNLTSGIENYLGYQFIEGPDLVQKFEEQVRQFPIDIVVDPSHRVTKVSRTGSLFEVGTESGDTYQGRTVIFATGKRPRQLNVPGENEFRGKGLSYCAICDGPLFEGMKVAIVGGGNSALEATIDMLKIAEHVYLVAIGDLTCDPVLGDAIKGAKNLTVLTNHQVKEVYGEKMVTGITVESQEAGEAKRLEVGGVFVEIGLEPNSEAVKGLVKYNDLKEVVVNNACETGVPGLFAAGDVTDVPEKQIVVAAGEGSKAALAANKFLQRLGRDVVERK